VTDKDRYVDETLKKQIQESYGASDEQLKARMDRIERTLTDDEFAGAEDRIMAKLMARIGAPEPKEEKVEVVTEIVAEAAVETTEEAAEKISEVEEIVVEVETKVETETPTEIPEIEEVLSEDAESVSEVEEETSATAVAGEEKVIRFGRKKVILVAALAAAFIGVLGVTAIGEKSYFFREDERRVETIFDSGKSIADVSSFEESYVAIQEFFGTRVFSMNYIPEKALFDELVFDGNKAVLKMDYEGNYLYLIQWKRSEESSLSINSDRKGNRVVENVWLGSTVSYSENVLGDGTIEVEAQIENNGMVAWIFGKVEREEFEKILKNIYLY